MSFPSSEKVWLMPCTGDYLTRLPFHWKHGWSRFWAMLVFPPRITKHFMLLILLLCWCTHTRTVHVCGREQQKIPSSSPTLCNACLLNLFRLSFFSSLSSTFNDLLETWSSIDLILFMHFGGFFVLPRKASTVKSSTESGLLRSQGFTSLSKTPKDP